MDNLTSGAIKFMQEDFKEYGELFESLRNKQNPHTLFIGCSDSRVIPNLITNTGPGEFFMTRNITNIVPSYRAGQDYLATTSATEYALNSLRTKNIAICGHSNYGGCNTLYYSDEELDKTPSVKKWLTMLDPTKRDVTIFARDDTAIRSWLTEKLNLVSSLQNIFTYPEVQEALDEGRLEVHAWYYIIETGEIYEYDFKTKTFKLVQNRKTQ